MQYVNSLFQQPRHVHGTRILINIIALFLIYRFVTEFWHADFIYSHSLTFSPEYARIGLLLTLFSAILMLLGKYVNLAMIVATLSFWYLSDISISGDGGDNILRLVLLYLSFVHHGIFKDQVKPGLRVFVHNLAVFSIIAQVMILYFVAGTSKMQGDMWMQGTAMYYVLSTEEFGPASALVRDLFKHPFVTSFASHLTMVYQVAFPFMIHNRFHLAWALMGIVLHIGIALTMGLVTFSLIMIGLILFTINDAEWAKLSAIWRGLDERIRSRFKPLLQRTGVGQTQAGPETTAQWSGGRMSPAVEE